jgi:hypothetical protein
MKYCCSTPVLAGMLHAPKLLLSILVVVLCMVVQTHAADCPAPELSALENWLDNVRANIQNATLPRVTSTCPTPLHKKKVLLIGVDGLRADAAAMLPLPNIRRLERFGSWSYFANLQSTGSAVSGPGWASLLTGVEPVKHKVDGNSDMRDIAYPTVLKTVKDALKKKTAASCSWAPLIDDFIDNTDPATLDASFKSSGNDEAMANAAVKWINNGTYDLVFVDFDYCDQTGHSYGFDGYNANYQAAVTKTDGLIGLLLNAIFARSGEEWLIVLTTDHGGNGFSHGAFDMQNRRVPLLVASNSPRVKIGPAPTNDPGSHMDVLPTIHHFLGIPIPSGLDGQVFGFLDYVRTPPNTGNCTSDPPNCGCDQQADYRGNISVTASGKTCQAWNSQTPHQHTRTPDDYPNDGLDSNFCRNPDGEARAWCYTMDPNTRWELCDIPVCGSNLGRSPTAPILKPVIAPAPKPMAPVSVSCISDPPNCGCDQQADYRGNISVTASGKTCQAWNSQTPHQHTRTPDNYPSSGLDSSFCRNPDGEARAWCYTMDPNTRWELCSVPFCRSSANPTPATPVIPALPKLSAPVKPALPLKPALPKPALPLKPKPALPLKPALPKPALPLKPALPKPALPLKPALPKPAAPVRPK